jgi:hypothetical protein
VNNVTNEDVDKPIPWRDLLSPGLIVALKDCDSYAKHRPYVWKPKTMQRLEALGLAEPDMLMHAGKVAYHLTDKGREALTALKDAQP